jgi:hypothetical protein
VHAFDRRREGNKLDTCRCAVCAARGSGRGAPQSRWWRLLVGSRRGAGFAIVMPGVGRQPVCRGQRGYAAEVAQPAEPPPADGGPDVAASGRRAGSSATERCGDGGLPSTSRVARGHDGGRARRCCARRRLCDAMLVLTPEERRRSCASAEGYRHDLHRQRRPRHGQHLELRNAIASERVVNSRSAPASSASWISSMDFRSVMSENGQTRSGLLDKGVNDTSTTGARRELRCDLRTRCALSMASFAASHDWHLLPADLSGEDAGKRAALLSVRGEAGGGRVFHAAGARPGRIGGRERASGRSRMRVSRRGS